MNKDRTIVAGHWRVTIDDDRQRPVALLSVSGARPRRPTVVVSPLIALMRNQRRN
jgi:hypothetical protein